MSLKKSRFLYKVKHGQKVIYYHSITKKFLVVTRKESIVLSKIINKPEDFISDYENVIIMLKSYGFITDNTNVEIDELILKNKLAVFSDKHYMLTINPTLYCNLNCWYCEATHEKKTIISNEVVQKIKKHIKYLVDNNFITGLHLDWFGGEPLLGFKEAIYPISKYAIEILKDKYEFTHHITTNGTLITKDLCDKFNEINLRSFQITMDGIESKHNEVKNIRGKATYEIVTKNINLVLENVIDSKVVLRINYDNETLSNINSLFLEFPKKYRHRIIVDWQRVWQTKAENNVNKRLEELLYYVKELGYQTRYTLFDPRPYHTCYADRFFHAVINYDGKVYKCTSGYYDESNVKGVLLENGVINWNNEIHSMFSKATFQNTECLKCKYLTFCFGPCTQKIEELNNNCIDLKQSCPKNFHELKLDSYIIFLAREAGYII